MRCGTLTFMHLSFCRRREVGQLICWAAIDTVYREFCMLPLIASCLLSWSVNDQERPTDGGAAMPRPVLKQEGKESTWGWALDELGSREWRAMMTSLIKEKERQASGTASSRLGCALAGVGCAMVDHA